MAQYDVLIIGGGAAGLMAAARLSGGGAKCALIEQSDRVGRKILATGNGRCNLLNMHSGDEHYFSRDMRRIHAVLGAYPPKRLLSEFAELGLMTREEENGRVYPLSGQAASVLDTLRLAVQERNTDVICSSPVTSLETVRLGFRAGLSDGTYVNARYAILACGGRAQPTGPADKQSHGFDALKAMQALGHNVYAPMPVLTALRCDMNMLRGLKGVRVHCALTLCDAQTHKTLRREYGEALFTDYGVSGIAAMQLSRELDKARHCTLLIDLIPNVDENELAQMLLSRAERMPKRPVEQLLIGCLNRMLAQNVLRAAGIALSMYSIDLKCNEIKALAHAIKHLEINVKGALDFKSAQVMRGGLDLSGFDEALMSRRVNGLYACGEILDVDGECGGYNLMWAWASALTAADAILKSLQCVKSRSGIGRNGIDKNNRR